MYRLNYQTGEGMGKVEPQDGSSLAAPAVDANGNIYTRHVAPGLPIRIFDTDFNPLGNAVDSARGFSRSFEVSADGNSIYDTGYTTHVITVYSRQDEFSPYTVADSILKGFDSESLTFNADKTVLWASAGSFNDLPNRFPGLTTNWQPNTWYGYDVANKSIVGTIEWQFNTPDNPAERPRGLAFSPDGTIAYATVFGGNDYPAVQKFVKIGTSVEDGITDRWVPVETFVLKQNYPNPFNPATTIPFELQQPGEVVLKVYNSLGQEVATLVEERMSAGQHKITFNASDLPSGMYIYRLQYNGNVAQKRMVFVK
jgi:hypothetical protein